MKLKQSHLPSIVHKVCTGLTIAALGAGPAERILEGGGRLAGKFTEQLQQRLALSGRAAAPKAAAQPVERIPQALRFHRLEQVVHRMRLEGIQRVLAVSRGEDDCRRLLQLQQVARRLHAIHAGHTDIHQHDIRLPGGRRDRYDHDDTVMVIFNRGDDTVEFDTARFAERLDGFTHGTDVISGDRVGVTSTLKLDPLSVLVLELE